jgi:hypothetical protein
MNDLYLTRSELYNFFMNEFDYTTGEWGIASTFPTAITTDILWFIFTAVFVVYGIMSLIFVYHWNKYEIAAPLLFAGQTVYFAGSLLMLITAGLAIAAF